MKMTGLAHRQPYDLVRQPETGLVMVRGRMGGTGSPFNLGEVTVTRCVVRLETGEAGSSYCTRPPQAPRPCRRRLLTPFGSAKAKPGTEIETEIIRPLAEQPRQLQRKTSARKRPPRKVDFFTMVRGDD
jgi:alpha-D-ribose 1-methylphosphonate 5-triphosphate synthase subunit PhnG